MNDIWLSWLAGLIDGDGHFSISLMKQHNGKTFRVAVTPQIGITLKEEDKWLLKEIQKKLGRGKIYRRQSGNSRPIWSWQTTSLVDSIYCAKLFLPFLHLKKIKCKKFLEITEYWLQTANPEGSFVLKRLSGMKLRTYEDMMKIITIGYNLNSDRQTRRYKDKMTPAQWEPLIAAWYPKKSP